MSRMCSLALVFLLAGCAAQQTATLMLRGHQGAQGHGTLDRFTNTLTVKLNGQEYRGSMIMRTSTTSYGILGPSSTHYSNQASALLLGAGGQLRCDFGFDSLMTQAVGTCTDRDARLYDLLIQNP